MYLEIKFENKIGYIYFLVKDIFLLSNQIMFKHI